MGTLDMGRDAVDAAVRITGKAFFQGAIIASESLYSAVENAANKRCIAPGYVMYVILTQQKVGTGSDEQAAYAMGIARELYILCGHKPPREYDLPTGDDEHLVDDALAEVAQWASSEFVDQLTNTFIAVAHEGAKLVRGALEQEYGKPASEKQARHVLVTELMLRVKDHPFWFRDSITLHKILGLMFSFKDASPAE